MELWCRWNDLHPLERTSDPPASVSHLHISIDGIGVYQGMFRVLSLSHRSFYLMSGIL